MSKNRYEGLLILNLKGKEDNAQKIIERVEKDFKSAGAEIESVQKMDTHQFSYVADKVPSGFYVNFVFTAEPTTMAVLREKFSNDEDVFRQHYARLAAKKAA